ncbi:unnamed protein product [Symbiodinium sp. CCMP2592]|nr:unnamed protein product [Symbiodinium sp. CCMP2592]
MAAFGFLRLLALVYPIFAIREAVEKENLALRVGNTIKFHIMVKDCGSCSIFGTDKRRVTLKIKDTRSEGHPEWSFDYYLLNMDDVKEFFHIDHLYGVDPEAELQATLEVKQQYFVEALGYASCGTATKRITFDEVGPIHPIPAAVVPFDKAKRAGFYQLATLQLSMEVAKETDAPKERMIISDPDAGKVRARELAVDKEVESVMTESTTPTTTTTVLDLEVEKEVESVLATFTTTTSTTALDDDFHAPPVSTGSEAVAVEEHDEEEEHGEDTTVENVVDDVKEKAMAKQVNCKKCIFRLGIGLEGLRAYQLQGVIDALCDAEDCSSECKGAYGGLDLTCEQDEAAVKLMKRALITNIVKMEMEERKIKKATSPQDQQKLELAERASAREGNDLPANSPMVLATQACGGGPGEEAAWSRSELVRAAGGSSKKGKDKVAKRYLEGTCKERSKKIPVGGYKCSAVYTSLMGVKNKEKRGNCDFTRYLKHMAKNNFVEGCPEGLWRICEDGERCQGTRSTYALCVATEV